MALLARVAGAIVPPFCWACGGAALAHEPLCPRCRRSLRWRAPELTRLAGVEVWAPVVYDGPARPLVQALKFRGARGLARPLAAQIVAGAPEGVFTADTALVPVPLHRARARRRGYNQAELLARAVAERTGMTVADCLVRSGPAGGRQLGRGRRERLAAVEGSVALAGRTAPERAVIVDDVATTGATLAACARALSAAGTRRLVAVSYALTPGR